MREIAPTLNELTSDAALFPSLQIALLLFVLFAMIRNWFQVRKAGRDGVTLEVTRGNASMGLFYGTYAAISGLFIAICLSVDIAEHHRVLWVLFDTILIAYACLLNTWFRNLLLGWAEYLTKVEKR